MLSPDSPLSTSIQATCDRLKQLTQLDLQSQWRICQADLALEQALDAKSWADWSPANLNQRHHIAWIRGQQTLWLGQVVTIQPTLQGYPLQGLRLKLALTWWAELAEIYVDGVLRQCGDLFDCSTRLNLASAADLGQQFTLLIRLRSPGHDDGALVSSQLQFESNFGWDDALTEAPEPAYCGAEIHVLAHYLQHFQSEALPKLGQELADLDWQSVTQREPFDSQLQTLRDRLSIWSDWLKQRTIGLVGHAHLDLAWLWPIRDTWVAAERTFESVLALCEEFPELIFTHSTPALYAWLQAHRPELFARIQTAASQGKWDVAAGLWVEPDLVLTSGEAIARQILYGQHYTQAQFGQVSRVAWLPDSFGFTQQLPQLLRQGGIDYFVTQKLRWNDTTQFPHTLFNWQAPDGTASFSMMSAPIGRGIDPVELATYATDWEQQTGSQICLWLPGVGDHGGGPTRDMLETVRRWQRSPLFPRLEFMGVHTFLEQLEQHIQPQLQSNQLATWSQDLYLELHRGCYTTHAEQKWLNRRTETTLCEAEIFASLATLLAGYNYPKAALEEAWKQILFNQFHDILPGSAIPEVFTEANPNWEAALATAQQCRDDAIAALAQQIHYPAAPYPGAQPVLVFNSLNWERSELVTVSYPLAQAAAPEPNPKNEDWVALTEQHEYLPCQITSEGELLFQAVAIPSVGYRLFWLCERSRLSNPTPAQPSSTSLSETSLQVEESAQAIKLRNETLEISFDRTTGQILQLRDLVLQQDCLAQPANCLQCFTDKGQYWDAWNIDPDYEQHQLPAPTLSKLQWLEQGPLRLRLRLIYQFQRSRLQQDLILEAGSPLLKIQMQVDWQEDYVLLKVAFPLNLQASSVTCEAACGVNIYPTQQATQPQTPVEKAQWEVPAHRWADLSSADWGLSILNDCKYGYDAKPDQLRLTLLRSPKWPDPESDRGQHQFAYALYPHAGNWHSAQTVRQGYAFNQPLLACYPTQQPSQVATLPPTKSLLNLGGNSLVLMTLKPAELQSHAANSPATNLPATKTQDIPSTWILRCYESRGESTDLCLHTAFAWASVQSTDLLETDSTEPHPSTVAKILPTTQVSIAPWQIVSLQLIEALA